MQAHIFIHRDTVCMQILSDEEVGGHHGMEPFVNSEHFERLNVGVDIDECEINAGNVLLISTAEKAIWRKQRFSKLKLCYIKKLYIFQSLI